MTTTACVEIGWQRRLFPGAWYARRRASEWHAPADPSASRQLGRLGCNDRETVAGLRSPCLLIPPRLPVSHRPLRRRVSIRLDVAASTCFKFSANHTEDERRSEGLAPTPTGEACRTAGEERRE